MDNFVNLIKLSVGTESVETLTDWQDMRRAQSPDGLARHITRMRPKREAEIVAGGSIYWVIKGTVQCRQRILRFDEIIGEDGIRRCAFVLDPELHRTQNPLRRPFQGWRYLKPEDSPPDLREGQTTEDTLPPELNRALAEIGVI
ncbi:MAG: lysophospholipase [Rhodobacteraceae bacterium]|nr:MAG: lysophospholipase [Paracoccaceae bacterium]